MVDQIKLNGIVCQNHPEQLCQSFNHSEKASNPLLCLHCLQEQDVPLSQIVMFQTALNCQKTSYIMNWPPFYLDESEKAILKGSFSGILASIEIQKAQIENMIKQMLHDFEISLQNLKKKYFIQLDNQKDCADFIREIYVENSKIEELQQILKDCSSSHNVNQKLKEFISSNRPGFQESKIILQKAIEEFQQQKELDLNKLIKFTYNLAGYIDNLDLEEDNTMKTINDTQKQQQIDKENEETIKAQKKKIEELSQIISRIQEQMKSQEQQQQSARESQEQLQSSVFCNKVNLLESMQNDPLYPDKKSMVKECRLEKDFPPNNKEFKVKSIVCNHLCPKKRTLQEQKELPAIIEFIAQSIICDVKIKPSVFMKSMKKGRFAYSHLNYYLNPNSKYILRAQLKNVNRFCDLGIGLISEDLLTTGWGEYRELPFFTHNSTSTTIGKVVKGKNIWEKNYEGAFSRFGYLKNTVEIQLCISQKIFNVIDYPRRQNQVAIFEHARETIHEGNTYFIGFYVFGKGDQIKLYDFSEVEEFK